MKEKSLAIVLPVMFGFFIMGSYALGTQWAAMAIIAINWLYMLWLIKPIKSC